VDLGRLIIDRDLALIDRVSLLPHPDQRTMTALWSLELWTGKHLSAPDFDWKGWWESHRIGYSGPSVKRR
jgi:hypothetical protein